MKNLTLKTPRGSYTVYVGNVLFLSDVIKKELFSNRKVFVVFDEHTEYCADSRDKGSVSRGIEPYAGKRQHLRGYGGTDIRPHYNRSRLRKSHKTDVYETYEHYGGSRRTLNNPRDGCPDAYADETVTGHFTEQLFQIAAGNPFKIITHYVHTEQHYCHSAE